MNIDTTRGLQTADIQLGAVLCHESGIHYLVANVDNYAIALISLSDEANRWCNPVTVRCVSDLSDSDIANVCDGCSSQFEYVAQIEKLLQFKSTIG